MPLLSLPNELLLRVLSALTSTGDVYALLRTNRRLSILAVPRLRHSMLTNPGYTALAIFWAAASGNKVLLGDVLENNAARGLTLHTHANVHSPYIPIRIEMPERCDDATLDLLVREAANLELDWRGHQQPRSLLQAISAWNTPLVQILLERGVSPDPSDESVTALHLAARSQHRRIVELLLLRGANVATVHPKGLTALHFAVSIGQQWRPLDVEVTRLLLQSGCDPNARSPGGDTALHLATEIQSVPDSQAIVDLLLDHGADPTLHNQKGETAIDIALLIAREAPHTSLGRPTVQRQDLARLMLSRPTHTLPAAAAGTILHTGVRCHWDNSTTALLLQRGAVLDAPDSTGSTPLHTAVQSSARAVALLLAAGSDISLRNHAGQTALHTAARMSAVAPMILLLRHGADPSDRDNDGRTPLHVAAVYGRPRHFVLLLEAGAIIGARDGDGLAPLELAALRRAVGEGSRLRKRARLVRPEAEKEMWAGLLDGS
ncbi:hypothetical protein Q9L58_001174 [Maublancomyces gigas]|uniref:Uncharacterized protein n=1 Tax=Discina gigas TaxID=1032678 RepID=A0ABR3GV99_9PEZI